MRRTPKIILSALLVVFALCIGCWIWILTAHSPNTPIAKTFPWPIACSFRGCITSSQWYTQSVYDGAFAKQTNKTAPTDGETLTTLLRRHLITHASLQSPVTIKDAVRYRTEILHNTDIATLEPLGVSSFTEYDRMVVLPFLQQEALIQQGSIKNTDDLYSDLSKKRGLFLFLFNYTWNSTEGKALQK